ncbi:hypothetical protein NDI45_26695 [Leptolyngbya sp. GB1-A1]|uniref:hypothetical protein n=1 Tax=Leptolyngbya sp. GB1-A1 TaxID=2933908 RepID=UPI003297A5BF
MNKKMLSKFQRFLLVISATITLSVLLLFGSPSLAQVNPEPISRIEIVRGSSEDIPPVYRLVIGQPQQMVYVSCPTDFAPELSYVRNVEAIQCKSFPTP